MGIHFPGPEGFQNIQVGTLNQSIQLLGARTLLGAPGIATRSKKLLGAPGRTTRSKKLLVTRASFNPFCSIPSKGSWLSPPCRLRRKRGRSDRPAPHGLHAYSRPRVQPGEHHSHPHRGWIVSDSIAAQTAYSDCTAPPKWPATCTG